MTSTGRHRPDSLLAREITSDCYDRERQGGINHDPVPIAELNRDR